MSKDKGMNDPPTQEDHEVAARIVETWLETGDGGFGYGDLRALIAAALSEGGAGHREANDAAVCGHQVRRCLAKSRSLLALLRRVLFPAGLLPKMQDGALPMLVELVQIYVAAP
jgi:hypothetical protein